MKKLFLLLLLVAYTWSMQANGYVEVGTSRQITNEPTFIKFNANVSGQVSYPNPITSLTVSGDVVFSSSKGMVRIVLQDRFGKEKLVYEGISAFSSNGVNLSFSGEGVETRNLSSFWSDVVKIEVEDAVVKNITFTMTDLTSSPTWPANIWIRSSRSGVPEAMKPNYIANKERYKIKNLNTVLQSRGKLWVAGETPISRMSYEEKKAMFGGEVPNLRGFEYYKGGIFDFDDAALSPPVEPFNFPDEFDWRNVNQAMVYGSPYYQDSVLGWTTPVKSQGFAGTCWAFATAGALETLAKLYRNTSYNFDFSEQQLVSCSRGGDVESGFVHLATSYVTKNYLQDENSFPYAELEHKDCSSKREPVYGVKIENYDIGYQQKCDIVRMIEMIHQGPVAGALWYNWKHAMTLLGYKKLKLGDIVSVSNTKEFKVKEGNPLLGRFVWIFKNSWGTNHGNNGFAYVYASPLNMSYSTLPIGPLSFYLDSEKATPEIRKALADTIPYYDKDNDGYYWWGLGPKPNLPKNAQDVRDFDDSNASIGGFVKGRLVAIHSQDLYIRDNELDGGFEPNTTIENENFWSSPDIWIRNNNDGLEEHQNPIPNQDNYIYIRVRNRGLRRSISTPIQVHWAKSGTNLAWPEAWVTGYEKNGVKLGGTIPGYAMTPEIKPGETGIAVLKWHVPDPATFASLGAGIGGKESWHFCLLARIGCADEPNILFSDPNITRFIAGSNNVAQKNVVVMNVNEGVYEGMVSFYNMKDQVEKYSLEIVELKREAETTHNNKFTPNNGINLPSSNSNMRVQVSLTPEMYQRWVYDGSTSVGLEPSHAPYTNIVSGVGAKYENLRMNPKELSTLKFSVNMNTNPSLEIDLKEHKREFLVKQRDSEGNIVGGETFVVKWGSNRNFGEDMGVVIGGGTVDHGGLISLSAENVSEPADYTWLNSSGNVVGKEKSIKVTSIHDETYTVEAVAKRDGYLATASAKIEGEGIGLRVSPVPVKDQLTIHYQLPSGVYNILIVGLKNSTVYRQSKLDTTKQSIMFDVANLPAGYYTATVLDGSGKLVEEIKFVKE